MATCIGPNAAGIEWKCDMQHGLVDGRCADCQIMAEAGSNLSPERIAAVVRAVERGHRAKVIDPARLLAVVANIGGREFVFHPEDIKFVMPGEQELSA